MIRSAAKRMQKKNANSKKDKNKNMAKGGDATKTNKGAMDYRAGGMVLSVQDRRKKRG